MFPPRGSYLGSVRHSLGIDATLFAAFSKWKHSHERVLVSEMS